MGCKGSRKLSLQKAMAKKECISQEGKKIRKKAETIIPFLSLNRVLFLYYALEFHLEPSLVSAWQAGTSQVGILEATPFEADYHQNFHAGSRPIVRKFDSTVSCFARRAL